VIQPLLCSPSAPTVPDWVCDKLPPRLAGELDEIGRFLRSPADVMSPAAMRTMSRTRLSFADTLVARMISNGWAIRLVHCEVDGEGLGLIVYEIDAEDTTMHFGAFSYPPLPLGHQRLFRDTKTDFFGVLLAGPVDIDRLYREREQFDTAVWRGRTDSRVFGWTVASRGTRTFGNVIDALADGRQPDPVELERNGGYIIRNGGYYGNGRMGTRAWQSYASGGPFSTPYHVDLFCVYMWRLLSFDVADAAARARNPAAASLAPGLKRYLGIGNSSGLGTVAALVRWPARLSAYMTSRELAFAYVMSRKGPVDAVRRARLESLLTRAEHAYARAAEPTPGLVEDRHLVASVLASIRGDVVAGRGMDGSTYPWATLLEHAETYGSKESVELLRSLLLELYPEVDDLAEVTVTGMARECAVEPAMTVGELCRLIEQHSGWALRRDLHDPAARAYFWYRSEENGENRRGERAIDIGVERETFVDVAGTIRRLYDALAAIPEATSVGRFLLTEPEHTLGVARAQFARTSPFSEIQASACAEDFTPCDAIRCFLTVLGVELPEPHSARWVRGTFFRGAPLPEDIADGDGHDWILPERPEVAA
jgi:hypothetical protein